MITIQFVGSDDTSEKTNVRSIVEVALRQHGFTTREAAVDTLEVYVVPLGHHPDSYDPKAGYNDGPGTTQISGDGGSSE